MTRPPNAPPEPKKMGRPRNAEVDKRVMSSAMELFIRAGWQDFSIDEVARRAKVGKASVYLRWNDKAALLFDALSTAYQPWDVVLTGSLRKDLEALVVAIIGELSIDIGWAINRAQTEPDLPVFLKSLCQALINARLDVIASLIEAARARGEISGDAPADLIMESVTGAASGHAGLSLFAGHAAGSAEDYARRLIDFLYPSIIHGANIA